MKLLLVAAAVVALASAHWVPEVDFGAPKEHQGENARERRNAGNLPWSYDGETGAQHWGDLATAYAKCKTGTEQSPINLPTIPNGVAGDLVINWPGLSSPITVSNNGFAFQVSVSTNDQAANHYVTYKGKRYNFLQFHLHGYVRKMGYFSRKEGKQERK